MPLPQKGLQVFSLTTSYARPSHIFQYSKVGDEIRFNTDALHPMVVPSDLKPGIQYNPQTKAKWMTLEGLKDFNVGSQKIPQNRSTVENLLRTMIRYHQLNPGFKARQLLCHNGFFTDLALKTNDKYEIHIYRGQTIVVGCNRRDNNEKPQLAYCGLKFEQLLQQKSDAKVTNDHCKLLLDGEYKPFTFNSVVEIDGINPLIDEQADASMTPYIESKLCFINEEISSNTVKRWNDIECLKYIFKKCKRFDEKVLKYLFQSYFGKQDTLIIGVRNHKFQVQFIVEFSLVDLLKFIQSKHPRIYDRFQSGMQNVSKGLNVIKKQHSTNGETIPGSDFTVLKFDTRTFRLEKVKSQKEAARLFNRAIIKEYQEAKITGLPIEPTKNMRNACAPAREELDLEK